jgi:colanic acid/amylovoran/stewartan biosynthesis glycosyltransferase WcaL/AmsK/CpsK
MTQHSTSNEKMTVFHSVRVWLPRTENWIYNLLRFLPHEVNLHVVCESTINMEEFRLTQIHCFQQAATDRHFWNGPLRKISFRTYLGFMRALIRKHHAHLLHSHFGNHAWADLKVAREAHLPHLVTFYGFDVNYLPRLDPVWKQRYQELFDHCQGVLCEGPHMGRCLMELGCPESKVRLLHLGVATSEIPFRPRQLTPGEPLRILLAASFQEKKGLPAGIEALGALRERNVPFEATLIGDANSEPRSQNEKQKILQALAKHHLKDKVRLMGYLPHRILMEEAGRHHVFMAPSVTAEDGDTEGGLPVTLIEMAASGMPVVTTDHCDIPELVVAGVTGLQAPERNVDQLAEHLRWLYQNPAKWHSIADAARNRVEAEFDASRQGVRLGQIYRELIQGH